MSFFLTYSRHHTVEDADLLIELLILEKIPFIVDHEVNQLEKFYLGESPDPMVTLKIPQDQFSRLNALLTEVANSSVDAEDRDYYIYSFSNEELDTVINNPNEWNAFDRQLAARILNRENSHIVKRENSTSQFYQPAQLSFGWLILSYLISFFAIYGLFIGLSIVRGKKTLHNGDIVSIYDKNSIKHGDRMIVIASIMTFYFFFKMLRDMIQDAQRLIEYSSFGLN